MKASLLETLLVLIVVVMLALLASAVRERGQLRTVQADSLAQAKAVVDLRADLYALHQDHDRLAVSLVAFEGEALSRLASVEFAVSHPQPVKHHLPPWILGNDNEFRGRLEGLEHWRLNGKQVAHD